MGVHLRHIHLTHTTLPAMKIMVVQIKAMLTRFKYSNKQNATYNWEQSNLTAVSI